MFHGGRSEGVGRGQHDLLVVLHDEVGQLGDGCGLAHAVYAGDQNHACAGFGVLNRRERVFQIEGHVVTAEQLFERVSNGAPDFVEVDFSSAVVVADVVDDLRRRRDAHVRLNQASLKPLERIFVEDFPFAKPIAGVHLEDFSGFGEGTLEL